MSRRFWVAARDQVAHLQRPREPRTACGLTRVDERWAWPPRRRCATCRVLTETLGTTA